MRVLSSSYINSAKAKIRDILVQIKLKDAESTVLTMDKLYPIDIKRTITDGSFGVGFASSDRIAFAAATTEKIAKNTRITLYNSFGGDYERLGRFYCETSPRNGNMIEVTAFDAMNVIRERTVKFTGIASKDIPALTFPCKMQEVLDYVVAKNGLTCDFQCEDFVVQEKPTKSNTEYYTDPEILGFIASAHACNVKFDYEGKLVFVGFSQVDVDFSADNVIDITIDDSEPFEVTGILFTVGDDTIYIDDVAGSEYDEEAPGVIKIDNPLATVEIAEYVWRKLGGLKYYGGSITIRGMGLLECGDVINVKNLKTPDDQAEYPLCITSISYSIDSNGFIEKITSDVSKSKGKSLSSSSTASSGGGTSYLAGEGLSLNQNVFSLNPANQGYLGGIRVSAYATVPEDSPPSDFNSGIYKIDPGDAFLGLRRATKNQMGGLYLGDGLAPTVEQDGETFTNTGHVEVRIGEGLEYLENSENPADERERRQNVLGGRAVAVTKATKEKFGMVKLGNRIGIDADGSIYSAMFGKKGIEVSDKGEISVLIDDETIRIDGNGKLCAQVNADGVSIENAIVIQEDNAKAFIRYFSSVEYKDGNRIGYGGADNPIPVQTYPVYAEGTLSNGSTASIPEDIHFRQTFVFPTTILYGTASEDTEIKGIELELFASYPTRTDFYVVLVDSSGTKIRIGSQLQVHSTAVEFYIGLILRWTLIRPPGFVTPAGTVCPYGCAESPGLASVYSQANTTMPYRTALISAGSTQKLYLRFRDETEYKAAVGLTENIEETLLLAVVSEEQE